MSIATELQDLNDNIKAAYNKVSSLQGDVPADKNMVNLPAAIDTVRQYDIHLKYTNSQGATLYRGDPIARTVNEPFLPPNVATIDQRALAYAYDGMSQYSSAERRGTNFENIVRIGISGMSHAFTNYYGDGMFIFRGSVKDINFNSLAEVSSYGLNYAYAYNEVEAINFPELVTASYNSFESAFYESSAAGATASFPKLKTVGSSAFKNTFASPNGNTKGLVSADFSGLEKIDGAYDAFSGAFRGNKQLASVDFSSLWSVKGNGAFNNAFYGCLALTDTSCFRGLKEVIGSSSTGEFRDCFNSSGLQTVNFPELTTATTIAGVFYNAFRSCTSLTTASFPKLAAAPSQCFSNAFYDDTALTSFSAPLMQSAGSSSFSYAFYNCTSLTTVSLTSLASVEYRCFDYAFRGCTSLTSISFPALSAINSYNSNSCFSSAFSGCSALTSVSFPAVTASSFATNYALSSLLSGTSGVTLHFPAGTESAVQVLIGYPNFGGTNTTVLFDL